MHEMHGGSHDAMSHGGEASMSMDAMVSDMRLSLIHI